MHSMQHLHGVHRHVVGYAVCVDARSLRVHTRANVGLLCDGGGWQAGRLAGRQRVYAHTDHGLFHELLRFTMIACAGRRPGRRKQASCKGHSGVQVFGSSVQAATHRHGFVLPLSVCRPASTPIEVNVSTCVSPCASHTVTRRDGDSPSRPSRIWILNQSTLQVFEAFERESARARN